MSGNRAGRPSTKFIRKILRERDEGGKPLREQIVRHLIEVATKWQVIVLGKNLEVASARDSVEAAKLLLSYDVGKPGDMPEPKVAIPSGVVTAGRPLLNVLSDVYRLRLEAGDLTPSELARLSEISLAVEKTNLQLVLALLGKNVAGKTPEEIRKLIDGEPKGAELEAPKAGPEGGTNG